MIKLFKYPVQNLKLLSLWFVIICGQVAVLVFVASVLVFAASLQRCMVVHSGGGMQTNKYTNRHQGFGFLKVLGFLGGNMQGFKRCLYITFGAAYNKDF